MPNVAVSLMQRLKIWYLVRSSYFGTCKVLLCTNEHKHLRPHTKFDWAKHKHNILQSEREYMIRNSRDTAFDDQRIICANSSAYVSNPKTENGRVPAMYKISIDRVPCNLENGEKIEPPLRDVKIPTSQSLDTIRINTNSNRGTNIRLFLKDTEISPNHMCDWDPMENLAGMLSDCPTDKDVLETLDELRDRFRE